MSMYRAKRGPIIVIAVLIGFVLFFYSPWELSSSLIPGQRGEVNELYGLLRLVTGDQPGNDHVLNDPQLDPTETVDWSVYAAGEPDVNWWKEAKRINKVHPIIVFSKTYCPYSKRAKKLLESYDITPPPKVIEVDVRDDGIVIKNLLSRLTGHSTFPNIIVQGKSIGGSDNLAGLHSSKELRNLIEKAGAKARKNGPEETD
ncbi:thioredoxin-like protein [Ephemerocybe angulata]|uniref:Thioredoxin-like protein n=1 Tax=Ephemerocybe angulata TaxID=980116 RepID=A0A8H6ICQ8_9AGAR|nr:thioredoxin-like protein [Tulosesus angulatus]